MNPIKCYFCHKRIVGDYAIIEREGKEKFLHQICALKLRKVVEKNRKIELEKKKQAKLIRYEGVEST